MLLCHHGYLIFCFMFSLREKTIERIGESLFSNNTTALQISYVLDTEDFFFRFGKKRKTIVGRSSYHSQARVERFHCLLASSSRKDAL